MLELGKMNTFKKKQIENREEFIKWLSNVLYEIKTNKINETAERNIQEIIDRFFFFANTSEENI